MDNYNDIEALKATEGFLKGADFICERRLKNGQILRHYQFEGVDVICSDGYIQSVVDIADPSFIYSPYIKQIADMIAGENPNAQAELGNYTKYSVLHLGVGAGSLSRWVYNNYPDVYQLGVDINAEFIEYAREKMGLLSGRHFKVRIGDALDELQHIPDSSFSAIIRDVFIQSASPKHLTSPEFYELALSKLRKNGQLICNIIDTFQHHDFLDAEISNASLALKKMGEKTDTEGTLEIICTPALARNTKKHKIKPNEVVNYLLRLVVKQGQI